MRYVILNLEKYEIEYKTDQSSSEATKIYNLKVKLYLGFILCLCF